MFWTYLLRRLAQGVPVLFGVAAITFVLLHATAGGYVPGLDLSDPRYTVEQAAALRTYYGLDQPLHVQFLSWFTNLLRGDLGRSMIDGAPISEHILGRVPNTLLLTVTALVVAVIVAIPIGIVSALNRGQAIDHVLTTASVAGIAVPTFWLGLLLIYAFAVLPSQVLGAPLLPSSGASSPVGGGGFFDRLSHLILPATVTSFRYIVVWSRFVRSGMLEVLSQEYVRTARAKGLAERRVLYGHALRNALIPLVTLIGLELPGLFSGGVIVEVIFGWPGVGRFAFERALAYDFTTVMGVTVFTTFLIVLGNFLADVLYGVADPRVAQYGR